SSPSAELEERDRRAHLKAITVSYWRRHQLSVRRVVKQFPPVLSPAWPAAPASRDLPLAAAIGEALHPDFIPPRLIRDVGQPPPIGRECPRNFIRFRPDHGIWLRINASGHWQDPHIP